MFKQPEELYAQVSHKSSKANAKRACGFYLCPNAPVLVAVDDENELAHPVKLDYDNLLALREWIEERIDAHQS